MSSMSLQSRLLLFVCRYPTNGCCGVARSSRSTGTNFNVSISFSVITPVAVAAQVQEHPRAVRPQVQVRDVQDGAHLQVLSDPVWYRLLHLPSSP